MNKHMRKQQTYRGRMHIYITQVLSKMTETSRVDHEGALDSPLGLWMLTIVPIWFSGEYLFAHVGSPQIGYFIAYLNIAYGWKLTLSDMVLIAIEANHLVVKSFTLIALIALIRGFKLAVREIWGKGTRSAKTYSLCIGIGSAMAAIIDYVEGERRLNTNMDITFDAGSILLLMAFYLLVTGILTSVTEELCFRGFVYRVLLKRFDMKKAVVLSAAIFALVHPHYLNDSVASSLAVFAIGTLAAVLVNKTRSLAAPLILHMSYNMVSICLNFARLR